MRGGRCSSRNTASRRRVACRISARTGWTMAGMRSAPRRMVQAHLGDDRPRATRRAHALVAQRRERRAELWPPGGVRRPRRRDPRAGRRCGAVAGVTVRRAGRLGRIAGRGGPVLSVSGASGRPGARGGSVRRGDRQLSAGPGPISAPRRVSERDRLRARGGAERHERRAAAGSAVVQPVPRTSAGEGSNGARSVLQRGRDGRPAEGRRRGRYVRFPVCDDEPLAHRPGRAHLSGAGREPRPVALWPHRGVDPRRLVRGSRRPRHGSTTSLGVAQRHRSVGAADHGAVPPRRPLRDRDHGRGALHGPGGGSRQRGGTRRVACDPDICLAHLGGAGVARAFEGCVFRVARGVGSVVRGNPVLALLAVPALLTAQLPAAEAAFGRGEYAAARAAYERVLATDSVNVRALYRLAILDSWDGKLTLSLQRFARLRRLEPRDGDIMVSQARVVAWSGDLDKAEQLWRAALAAHPDAAELLIGLAQTLYWKGQPGLAEAYAARARAAAPDDRTARDLARAVRAALRPEVATTADGAGDSDHNDFVAQEASFTGSPGGTLRGTLHAGWRHATDPAGDGTSFGAGGDVMAALGRGAVLRAGLGARRIEPDVAPARTPLTAQLGLGVRPARYAAVSVAYSRTPFDETAGLMRQDLMIDAVDLSFDVSPGAGWSISGGGGGAWFSDGNRRYSAVGAVLGRVVRGLQLGPFARALGYRRGAPGLYFAPDRFSVLEARVVYQWQRSRWGLRTDGGIGAEQVFRGAAHQTEWHFGVTLSRGWGANNEVALVGSITNSAGATSTTGTRTEGFRYRTLGLRLRQGL